MLPSLFVLKYYIFHKNYLANILLCKDLMIVPLDELTLDLMICLFLEIESPFLFDEVLNCTFRVGGLGLSVWLTQFPKVYSPSLDPTALKVTLRAAAGAEC